MELNAFKIHHYIFGINNIFKWFISDLFTNIFITLNDNFYIMFEYFLIRQGLHCNYFILCNVLDFPFLVCCSAVIQHQCKLMFVFLSILVPNQFVLCGDTFILISDTMQYDNVHIKQNSYLDVLKSQRIQRVHLDI